MSRTLKIELKPIGPYFFGNDRIFHYGKDDISRIGGSKYFIRSEKIPLQTSLFGVLRYLGILDKKMQIAPLSEEDKKNIGKESFEYEKEQQVFGEIEKLSPLYLKRLHCEMSMKMKTNCRAPFILWGRTTIT